MTEDAGVLAEMKKNGQIALRYCDAAGAIVESFPVNPNGSVENIAGVSNREGNVLAMMPHPERATWLRQVPEDLAGRWGRDRRGAAGEAGRMEERGAGTRVLRRAPRREGRGSAMKTPVQLWVRLKVIDLVTQTARITLTEKLDFADALRGMTHYWYWGMDAEAADAQSALDGDRPRDPARQRVHEPEQASATGSRRGTGRVRGDLALEKDFRGLGDTPRRAHWAAATGLRAGRASSPSTASSARGGRIGRSDSRSASTRGSRESPFPI